MKRLLIISLLLTTTFRVNAQDGKPTKEQTLSYLAKTFKLSEGETLVHTIHKTKTYAVMNFTIDKISALEKMRS